MITTKQRAYLRGLANKIPALYQVGKGGVNEKFIDMIDKTLEKNELIKITVQDNLGAVTREVCDEIVLKTQAQPVQVIGSKIVLYRKSVNNPVIELPR